MIYALNTKAHLVPIIVS